MLRKLTQPGTRPTALGCRGIGSRQRCCDCRNFSKGKTMSKVSGLMPRAFLSLPAFLGLLVFVSVLGSAASAQQPPTVRVRGTIEAVDGTLLTVKSREGNDVKVRLTDNAAVVGVANIALSEIKPGSYIGVSALPEADGTQKALAVHIFPEAQRGVAEGFRPWDLRPNSTMTNATVAETVASTDGQVITARRKSWSRRERPWSRSFRARTPN